MRVQARRRRYPETEWWRRPSRPGGTPIPPTSTLPPWIVPVDDSGIVPPDFDLPIEYKVLVYESLSGNLVTSLPVTYLNYTKVLKGPGGGEIHCPLRTNKASPDYDESSFEKFTSNDIEEYRHIIGIERNGVLVFAGFLGRSLVSSSDRRVQFAIVGLWDYFRNRYVRGWGARDYPTAMQTMRAMVDQAQSQGYNTNIHVQTGSEVGGTIQTSLQCNDYDFRHYGDVIEDHCSINSIDFRIDSSYTTDGLLQHLFVMGYPKLGRDAQFVAELERNIQAYAWQRDGDQRRTRVWGIGAGEADQLVLAESEDTTVSNIIPLREGVLSRKALDQSKFNELQALTARQQTLYRQPVEILSLTVDATDAVGAFEVGDTIPVVIKEGFVNIDTRMRVTSITVRAQDNLSETVDIELGPTEVLGG